MSAPRPNTTITLYVDATLKGAGIRHDNGDYRPGCWVGLVAHRGAEGKILRVESLRLTEAVNRANAEEAVRRHLGIQPRRVLEFKPTSAASLSWSTDLYLRRDLRPL